MSKMPAIKWTDEQENAINYPHTHSAVVTAAAGSGKTALLVERVVRLLKGNGAEPVRADKLAILTFTRNAAEEFRARMTSAIEKAAKCSGEDAVSREQMIRFRSAPISTIDSFCLNIIKENIELFDLPVNFSIIDESQAKLLKAQALDIAMEYFYSQAFEEDICAYLCGADKPSAKEKAEITAHARELVLKTFSFSDDSKLREAVVQVYDKAASLSDPNAWLEESVHAYSSIEAAEKHFLPVIAERICALVGKLRSFDGMMLSAINAGSEDFKERFMTVYDVDTLITENISDAFERHINGKAALTLDDVECFSAAILPPQYGKFPAGGPRKNQAYSELKAEFDQYRSVFKSTVTQTIEACAYSAQEVKEQLADQYCAVCTLVQIVKQLEEEYTVLKRRSGGIDFADAERLLLEKLREQAPQGEQLNALRRSLTERFDCIIVDEFQDTNDLQFEIFKLISKDETDLFFVGDIKQSIYAFRGGNPAIMAALCDESCDSFTTLRLSSNFRCRKEVINTVNAMFSAVMTRKFGDVSYKDGNQLTAAAVFPDIPEDSTDRRTELHLLKFPTVSDTPDPDADDPTLIPEKLSDSLAEARYVANKIYEMAASGYKIKRDGSSLRPCSWGDFAILLRSKSNMQGYKAELERLGIPVSTNSGSAYLDSQEIRLILDYLKIIDNPMLDEELFNVLMSPIYRMTDEEMALARLGMLGYDTKQLQNSGLELTPLFNTFKHRSLYQCVKYAAHRDTTEEENTDESEEAYEEEAHTSPENEKEYRTLREQLFAALAQKKIYRIGNAKCAQFLRHFGSFRSFAANNSVERLIKKIYDDTDFLTVISASEMGHKRVANIRLLLKYAADFENSGGGSLSDFLRYTDVLGAAQGTLPEAVAPQDAANAVRIMTFHASKGLEMPIVFLCDLGKRFYDEAARNRLLIHRTAGIGIKHVDLEKRYTTATLGFNSIEAKAAQGEIGEELRLLYVAMTRAQEKLIMTGSITKTGLDRCYIKDFSPEQALSGNDPLEWILSALLKDHGDARPEPELPLEITAADAVVYTYEDIPPALPPILEQPLPEPSKQTEQPAALPNEQAAASISRALNFKYEYEEQTRVRSKFSVTEIARMDVPETDDSEEELTDIPHVQEEPWVRMTTTLTKPSFGHSGKLNGALVGNTYHHIMELIPLERLRSGSDTAAIVREEIEKLKHRLTPDEQGCYEQMHERIDRRVAGFFESALGRRMLRARRIEREYALFAQLPVREAFDGEYDSDAATIIQGRIDMFFIEEDSIVIVDYKSDTTASMQKEFPAYKKQLRLYRSILPRLFPESKTGIRRIELYLYSFTKGCEIDIDGLDSFPKE